MTLLASIHDVAPPHLAAVQALRDALHLWGVDRATLLVVPDYHGGSPLGRHVETVRWLRARAAAGDEICLHGARHLAEAPVAGAGDRLRAALLTAGEGECLAQDQATRRRMLVEGRALLEDLVGVPVRGFVAPAWLEPRGFAADLGAAGFAWHEGSLWIERVGARRPTRTPVIGFATRTLGRRLASVAWAGLLLAPLAVAPQARGWVGRVWGPRMEPAREDGDRLLAVAPRVAPTRPVRVALHPADRRSPLVLAAAGAAVRTLRRAHGPAATYATALGIESA